MSKIHPLLALTAARGGSRGLPGKNIRPLAGLPLIAHSILCARMCPQIDRYIVSTDDDEIMNAARRYEAQTPFRRPADLARDDTPMLAVIQHALQEMERIDETRYETLLLLDPTSPGRTPEDIGKAVDLLEQHDSAVGVVAVSEPEFNPYWHCVIEKEGFMTPLIEGAQRYTRRQDVPPVYRINAMLYLWRRDYILTCKESWMDGNHVMLILPDERAIHIDHVEEFNRADLMLKSGVIQFPWLTKT